jgi:hypothetical protein
MALPGFADSRLRLLCGGNFCRRRPSLEPDEYLRSRVDPSQVDFRTVSVCARGHRSDFSGRFRIAALLRREVQEEKE